MTLQQLPIPARSDIRTGTPAPAQAPATQRPYVRHGLLLAAGAATWAAGMFAFGLEPEGDFAMALATGSAGVFQVGLLALLRVFWRSQALGAGKLARYALRFETGLVLLAMLSTLADMTQLSDLSQPGWAALDATWPLSMLGMMLIGIRVSVAGRWKGAARYWPLIAESWAPVVIPVYGIFGAGVAQWVAPMHLLVGYATLGLIVSRKRR